VDLSVRRCREARCLTMKDMHEEKSLNPSSKLLDRKESEESEFASRLEVGEKDVGGTDCIWHV